MQTDSELLFPHMPDAVFRRMLYKSVTYHHSVSDHDTFRLVCALSVVMYIDEKLRYIKADNVALMSDCPDVQVILELHRPYMFESCVKLFVRGVCDTMYICCFIVASFNGATVVSFASLLCLHVALVARITILPCRGNISGLCYGNNLTRNNRMTCS